MLLKRLLIHKTVIQCPESDFLLQCHTLSDKCIRPLNFVMAAPWLPGVIVDDTDSAITYTGPWFAVKGSLDNMGTYGAPYLSTSHGMNSTGNFSFVFTGTQLSCLLSAKMF